MSSQEQSFVIALFLVEKRHFFHNSEFWIVLFEITSLSQSYNQLYVLAECSKVVHHTNTPLLGKNKYGAMT